MADCTPIITVDQEVTEIEVVSPENTVQVDTQLTEIETQVTSNEIAPDVTTTTLETVSQEVTITLVGSQGPAGIAESEMVYAERVDFIGDNLIYRAEAAAGTLNSQALWRIRRLTINPLSDDDITTEWADGVSTFTKVWDDRLGLGYS